MSGKNSHEFHYFVVCRSMPVGSDLKGITADPTSELYSVMWSSNYKTRPCVRGFFARLLSANALVYPGFNEYYSLESLNVRRQWAPRGEVCGVRLFQRPRQPLGIKEVHGEAGCLSIGL